MDSVIISGFSNTKLRNSTHKFRNDDFITKKYSTSDELANVKTILKVFFGGGGWGVVV